jgi:hypothetical protein
LHTAAKFLIPTNPGAFPTTVDQTDEVIRMRQIAEHKAEFETYLGVENFLRKAIVKTVDSEWIAEIESETMGFNHKTPIKILTHLRNNGRDLNHLDVTELIQQLQKDWDHIEAPATFFARGDKIEKQIQHCDLPLDMPLLKHPENSIQTCDDGRAKLRQIRHLPTSDRQV